MSSCALLAIAGRIYTLHRSEPGLRFALLPRAIAAIALTLSCTALQMWSEAHRLYARAMRARRSHAACGQHASADAGLTTRVVLV